MISASKLLCDKNIAHRACLQGKGDSTLLKPSAGWSCTKLYTVRMHNAKLRNHLVRKWNEVTVYQQISWVVLAESLYHTGDFIIIFNIEFIKSLEWFILGKAVKTEISYVDVTPCTGQPCKLKKGTEENVAVQFIPSKNSIKIIVLQVICMHVWVEVL